MINHDIPDLLEGFTLRACYADTDAAGVIHHARILEFFEPIGYTALAQAQNNSTL